MKTDFYTKTVLTVIALALVALVLQHSSIIPTASAKGTPMMNYAAVPVNPDGSINVKFDKTDEISVDIEDCSTTLPVDVKKVDGSYCDYPLHIEVYH